MSDLLIGLVLLFFVTVFVIRTVTKYKITKIKKISKVEKEKGEAFEEEVALFLETQENIKVLKNIIVPNGKRGTTEIDLVILSTRGFYALECKNYSGYVVGNPEEKNWTVCYNYNGYKKNVSFYNPLLQNAGHITALRKMFPKCYFQSIVLFGNNTSIKKELFQRKDVMNFTSFKTYFENYFPKRKESETQAVVDSLYDYLKSYENKNREAHIDYVSSFKKKEEGIA